MPARSPQPQFDRLPPRNWMLQSKRRARVFAGIAGLAVAIGTSIAEWFLYQTGESPLIMMVASDTFAGVLTFLLIAGVLGNLVERADAVRGELEMVAQVNHHIRNALQLISFSAYSTHDQETIMTVRQGTERIEWALREILEAGAREPPPVRKPPESEKPPEGEQPSGQLPA